jgi:hypothetical protein
MAGSPLEPNKNRQKNSPRVNAGRPEVGASGGVLIGGFGKD